MHITHYMSDDHRRCDDLFAAAEQAAAESRDDAAAAFDQFAHAMERHFSIEENLLFPRFEASSGSSAGPTQVMRSEHTQMRALIEDMRMSLQSGNEERYLDLSETLLVMMQQHNLKEEQILYPMTDQALGEDGDNLLRQIRES